jgi:hypothetical protein
VRIDRDHYATELPNHLRRWHIVFSITEIGGL